MRPDPMAERDGTGRPLTAVDRSFWDGRRVLVTGHTGFKGAWLSLWLQSLGAHVTGLSDHVLASPSLFDVAGVGDGMRTHWVDIRDPGPLTSAIRASEPEIVLHLAAQSLVRTSLEQPRLTYETNVMGTVNLLEAVRATPGVRVAIIVTSDKCYDNTDADRSHPDSDPMGGNDPYASSKGCAELVTAAYRRSFFGADGPGGGAEVPCRIATARAGNVIGGGDWSRDRLVPDAMRATLAGTRLEVRNPESVRPWQHVLNPLSGYLVLAQLLWAHPDLAGGWNFGPDDDDTVSVGSLLERIAARWTGPFAWHRDDGPHPAEERTLRIDSSHTRQALGWRPAWNLSAGVEALVEWYGAYRDGARMGDATRRQISEFEGAMARMIQPGTASSADRPPPGS